RRGRPVIQSASPRLARTLFLVRGWKHDHWWNSGRSCHHGRAASQPPHPGTGQASLGRRGLASTQGLTVIARPLGTFEPTVRPRGAWSVGRGAWRRSATIHGPREADFLVA